MALSPEEQFHDTRMELGHKIDLIQHARECLLRKFLAYDAAHGGNSVEEVRKFHFQKVLRELSEEAASHASRYGILEHGSLAFQSFVTALHVLFTSEQIKKFRTDARPRFRIFRPLTLLGTPVSDTPSKKELKDSEDFFQHRFGAYDLDPKKPSTHTPDAPTLTQHALQSRDIRLVVERLLSESDLTPAGVRGDISSILRRRPEIGADIGTLLLAKELLDSIQQNREILSKGRRALEGAERSIQEDLATLFSKDLEDSVKLVQKALELPKKNVLLGFIAVVASPFVAAIIPLLRTIFILPRAIAVGTRDAFVLTTGRGNERPKK